VERSADWIAQARRDLAHARVDIDHAYFDWACFSSQQAAEKAVKAVLNRLGAEPWGHSVAGLLAALPNAPPPSHELMLNALELDKVYIPFRYPDALPAGSPSTQYTAREAERMESHAREIVQYCEGRLSSVQP
jgi:HEPN domain-containing protein